MEVEYYYCSHCGFEGFNVYIDFSGNYANGQFGYCPECREENSIDEQK